MANQTITYPIKHRNPYPQVTFIIAIQKQTFSKAKWQDQNHFLGETMDTKEQGYEETKLLIDKNFINKL